MYTGKIIVEAATLTTDTGTTGVLDTVGDIAIIDVRDKVNVSIYVDQIIDNGTVTIVLEKSIDGTNFAALATVTEASFPAGANKSFEVTLSDANGMPLNAVVVRASVTVHTGSGTYTMHVAGTQRPEYR